MNIIGLCIDMIGAFMVFRFSPKAKYSTAVFYQSTEQPNMDRKANRENRFVRIGMLLLFIGFAFQLIGKLIATR